MSIVKTAVVPDLFRANPDRFDAICITTNGTVKNNGSCVMGRGNALQAKKLYPGIDKFLGGLIKKSGNKPYRLTYEMPPEKPWADIKVKEIRVSPSEKVVPWHIFSLPVKHQWYYKADLDFVIGNIGELRDLLDFYGVKNIAVPLPGCKNGKLSWKHDVLPRLTMISEIHPPSLEKFTFVTNNKRQLEE